MLKKYVFLFVLLVCNVNYADEPLNMSQWLQDAWQCPNLACANQQIDLIDTQITALIGERLAYAQRAELLRKTILGSRNLGEAHTVPMVEQQALQMGYPPIFARNIFNTIVIQTNFYVQQR
jgi:chorismate mutase